MQLQFSAHSATTNTTTVNINTKDNATVPSMARIMKECDGSISTGLTSNEMETSNSRVGSTVQVGIAGETKLHSENVTTEENFLKFVF